MPAFKKTLLLITTFLGSAVIGIVVLFLLSFLFAYLQMEFFRASHPGVGAVAGGISEVFVTAVPVLFGIIGVLLVLRWIDKRSH
jgi:hypothetical protein